jgi:hypothetical protein
LNLTPLSDKGIRAGMIIALKISVERYNELFLPTSNQKYYQSSNSIITIKHDVFIYIHIPLFIE